MKEIILKDTVEINISGLGSSGEGVGKVNGFTFFVPGALPGERVRARVNLLKKTYGTAVLSDILEASPERIEPPCPVYAECGGCQLQHLSYSGQLEVKGQQVKDALIRIGHLTEIPVEEVLAAPEIFRYRNKMQFPVAKTGGRIQIGCYAAKTHRVVAVDECALQKPENNKIASVVRMWMQKYNIPEYDERSGKGSVRHVLGRVGAKTGEVLVALVTNGSKLPQAKALAAMLKNEVPGFCGLCQNINTRRTNVILGPVTKVIAGQGTIKDKIGALSFNISAQSFFQVNTEQAERLYAKALEFAGLSGRETVFDVYAGTGTISLFLAQQAKFVYGIEIVASAVRDAQKNAEDNHCTNAEFILGDAAEELPKLVARGITPEVIVLDPPRAGCAEQVLATIAAVKPERIVYVSCNPATLARDAAYLAERGYKLIKVQPVDLFPQTTHVECCVCLERKHDA